jgi:prepilin-type N-terminal cleavage/methylation domain-containing protein
MRPARIHKERQRGFTLIELLTALGIFLLITGAAFTLLSSSQQRYQTESQVLSSFQEARLGLDQMVRDVNDAGFPPPTYANVDLTRVTSAPFAWSPGYPNNPCQIGTAGGGTCITSTDFAPGDFDIIIETAPNWPTDPNVWWIRYQLDGTTLMRGAAPKVARTNPDFAFTGQYAVVPFVQNVVNNVCPPQLPNCQTAYPGVFGGAPLPIFQYTCDTSVPQFPLPPCKDALGDNSPKNIRDVLITLIVAAPLPDATTGRPRLVQLNGRGRRINPNQ